MRCLCNLFLFSFRSGVPSPGVRGLLGVWAAAAAWQGLQGEPEPGSFRAVGLQFPSSSTKRGCLSAVVKHTSWGLSPLRGSMQLNTGISGLSPSLAGCSGR